MFFNFSRSLLVTFGILCCLKTVQAQTTDQNYPVTAQAFVVAQPGKKLSAYFSSTQALTVSLLLKDLTKTSIDVYLKWSIDGPGVRISSLDGYIPPRFISLQRGMLQRFSGLDLQNDYFRQDLIEEQGLQGSPMRASLPEGFYTFRVQALEAGTGREVSNLGETYFSITSPLPPVINLPFNGAVLSGRGRPAVEGSNASTPLSMTESKPIQIQWMPRHYKLPGNITSYDLKVCKIPEGYEPQEALDACVNPIIDDKGNPGTFYPSNTGIGNSIIGAWERGERYAVRVTVHEFDSNGEEVIFANEGRSEVTWFRYGAPCTSPSSFSMKEVGPGRVQVSWEAQEGVDSYKILYRLQGEDKWQVQSVSAATGTIQSLTKGKYEFAVQSGCTATLPDHSQTWDAGADENDQDELDPTLTNPLQLIVKASGCNAAPAQNLADYYSNFPAQETPADTTGKLKIPQCALQSGAFSDCSAEVPVIPLPTGTIPLSNPKTGDVLGIYDFAVFVVEAVPSSDGFSGKGLVRLPFLEGALMPVEFSGVKAWQSADANGGCVYEVTYCRSFSGSQSDGLAMKAKLFSILQARKTGHPEESAPLVFAGTLADALKGYDKTASSTADSLCPYKTAITLGSDQIIDALSELAVTLSSSKGKVLDGILKDLKAITDSLRGGQLVAGIYGKYDKILARLDSLKTTEIDNTTPVLAISAVEVSDLSTQSARMSWESTAEFSKYVIEYRDPSGGTLQETVTSPQVNLSRLQPGTDYTYRILAYQGDHVAATYGEAVFTTLKKVVPVPENLAYTAIGGDSVRVTWDPNRAHRAFKLTYKDENGKSHTLYPTTNSALLTGLDPGKYYDYEVVAYDAERIESEAANARLTAGEECKLGVGVYNAQNTIYLTGNQHRLLATGCLPANFSSSEINPISWSNGTPGVIGSDGKITFGDGEQGEVSVGGGFILPTRALNVNPTKNTFYTAICTMGSGATATTCTYTVEVKVSSPECKGDFKITASATDIIRGNSVTLQSGSCSGKTIWSNSLGEGLQKIIYPQAETKIFAQCVSGGFECYSNTLSITVASPPTACDLSLYVKSKHVIETGIFKWNAHRYLNVSSTGCDGGTIKWNVDANVTSGGSKTIGTTGVTVADMKSDNATITATCVIDGKECEPVVLTTNTPLKQCTDKSLKLTTQNALPGHVLVSTLDNSPFVLKDTFGNSYTSNKDNVVNVPLFVQKRLCKSLVSIDCGEVGIVIPALLYTTRLSYKSSNSGTVWNSTSNNINDISVMNTDSRQYQLSVTSSCNGVVKWTSNSNPDFYAEGESLTFSEDKSGTLENIYYIPYPKVTTTYSASCHTTGNDGSIVIFPATPEQTIIVNSNYCFRVDQNYLDINLGNSVKFTAHGCTNPVWVQGDIELGRGTELLVSPVSFDFLEPVSYTAICQELGCKQDVFVEVLPCNFKINAPATPVKIAEPTALTASGCSGGIVRWSTGETGSRITVKPVEETSYQAWCMINDLTLCDNAVLVHVDNLAPEKIECPNFSLTYQPVERCTPVTVTPVGCPAGGTVIWDNFTTTSGTEKYTFTPSATQKVSATCTTQYGQSASAELEIVPLGIYVTVAPKKVYAGVPVILRASGCVNSECKEGVYTWENKKTGETYSGSFIKVTLAETSNFIVRCEGGWDQDITIEAESVNCDIDYKSAIKENLTNVEINASWCDPQYPINWYRNTSVYGINGWSWTTVEYGAGANKSKVSVARLADRDDSYLVSCVKKGNVTPCLNGFSVLSVKSFTDNNVKGNLSGAGSSGPTNNPDPCNELAFMAKGGFVSPRGDDYASLYADWCPGSKVEWFLPNGSKIATLIPPSGSYGLMQTNDMATYTYKCYFKNNICEGQYTLSKSGSLRRGASEPITSQAADEQCTNSTRLSTAMEVYYKTLLCQTSNLYKGDRAAAEAFVNDMIASLKQRSPNASIKYPSDLTAVIEAMVAGDCARAAQLLAAANGAATIDNDDFNNQLIDSYGKVIDDLIPKEGAQCDAPPAPVVDSNVLELEGGRLAAIDYSKPFIAPDGRPVKLPQGAQPMFFIFSGTRGTPPAGTLQGFSYNGKTYFAEIFTGNRKFLGYRLLDDICSKNPYLDIYDHSAGTIAYYFEYFNENNKCGRYVKEGEYKFKTDGDDLLIESLADMTGELIVIIESKNCDTGNKFYKDFGLATGQYYNPAYSQNLLKEIDALVESLMDQGLYEEFLKTGATKLAGQNPGGKITENDLLILLNRLRDYQQALTEVYGAPSPTVFRKLLTFFQKYFEIKTTAPEPVVDCEIGDAIVPREWWDSDSPLNYLPITLPMAAGFVDGAYSMVHGLLQLPTVAKSISHLGACWFSPIYMIWGDNDCASTRSATISSLVFIKDMMDSDSEANQKASDFRNTINADLKVWGDQTFCFGSTQAQARCCDYHQGKLVFDIVSLFYGPGEIKAGLKGFKLGTYLGQKLTVEMASLLNKIKVPASMVLKPIRDVGLAIALSTATPLSDNALTIVKGIGPEVSMVLARTVASASAETMLKVEAFVAEGVPKVMSEAVGSIDNMPLKIVDEAGNEVIKDSYNIIFNELSQDNIILSQIQPQNNAVVPFAILSLAGLTRIPEKDTPGCEVCKTRTKAVCEAFLKIRTRAIAGGLNKTSSEAAINKICAAVGSEANLLAIAGKLNGVDFTGTTVSAFLSDVNQSLGTQALDGNLSSLDLGILNAWKTTTDNSNVGTSFARDFPLLKKIKEIKADDSKEDIFKSNTITSFDQFLKIYTSNTPCNTCPAPAEGSWAYRFPNLDEILSNSIEGYQHHNGKLDFTSSFFQGEALAAGSIEKRDGGQHMLKYMAERSYTDDAIWIDRNFSYAFPQAVNGSKQFDIYMGSNPSTPIWFVECKSYAETTPIDVDQFIAYLSVIDNFSRLRYVFNDRKRDINQARLKMQAVFQGSRANDIFDAIWNNTPLRSNLSFNNLTKSQAKIQFNSWVSSLENAVFIFVDVN